MISTPPVPAADRSAASGERPPRSRALRHRHLRNRHLLALDAAMLTVGAAAAFALRFEGGEWPVGAAAVLVTYVTLGVPLKLLALWKLGVYGRLWRYASFVDLEILAVAAATLVAIGTAVGAGVVPLMGLALGRVPLAALAIDALLGALAIAVPRVLLRAVSRQRRGRGGQRVVIAGAGAAGSMIVRELLDNPRLSAVPVAFVDDDPIKRGRVLHGLPVDGALEDLAGVAARHEAEAVIIAMPSAPGVIVRGVLQAAAQAGLTTRTVPGLYELLDGRKSVAALRPVAIEDLLRRDPVRTDLARVRTLAEGRTILVTGAGGSIGSELCRQIARLEPRRLVALGRGENSVFDIVQELRRTHPQLALESVIADVRDERRLDQLFAEHRPDVVFHAAAHKHVPLMERNVGEAILNNVLGTRVVARMAQRHGAERFVLVSSDKAVRPSSVMGATKRLAEGVLQELEGTGRCRFVAVRFGNVLGSRGSVIPIFLSQLEAGGPLTVTHPEMRRYFMTIPEAVQLVLQAGVMAEGGEVFVLDMGEPVRVVDLARDLIRLAGLEEGRDVEIRFSGVRPGEKLHEELFFDAEHAAPTEHPTVLRARTAALARREAWCIDRLIEMARGDASPDALRRGIRQLVPEYTGGDLAVGQALPAGEPADLAPEREVHAEAVTDCPEQPAAR